MEFHTEGDILNQQNTVNTATPFFKIDVDKSQAYIPGRVIGTDGNLQSKETVGCVAQVSITDKLEPADMSNNLARPNHEEFGASHPITDFDRDDQMSQRKFYKRIEGHKERTTITCGAVMIYVLCGLNLAISSQLFGLSEVMFDVMLLVILALGMQLKQSRVCACGLLVYSIINIIIVTISTGRPGGYLYVIAAILGVKGTFDFQKDWKLYRNN